MVVDGFIFFNELDVLELRLGTLYDVVDKFVLVESTVGFSGKPKPLYYFENAARFKQWADKIIHIIVTDSPNNGNAWDNEYHQRRAIGRGFAQLAPEDWVLVSDVDEIPRPEVVQQITGLHSHPEKTVITAQSQNGIWVLDQPMFYYKFNLRGDCGWAGTRLLQYKHFTDAQSIRHTDGVHVMNGGWHFSHCNGGAKAVQEKLFSGSHQELNQPRFTNIDQITRRMSNHIDMFDRSTKWEPVEIDATWPKYFLDNQERFKDYIWKG